MTQSPWFGLMERVRRSKIGWWLIISTHWFMVGCVEKGFAKFGGWIPSITWSSQMCRQGDDLQINFFVVQMYWERQLPMTVGLDVQEGILEAVTLKSFCFDVIPIARDGWLVRFYWKSRLAICVRKSAVIGGFGVTRLAATISVSLSFFKRIPKWQKLR